MSIIEHQSGEKPSEANARLIASAPELIAVLKRLCEEFGVFRDGSPHDGTLWLEARAVIAKAEGMDAE